MGRHNGTSSTNSIQCHLEMTVVMTGVVRGVLNACHFTIGVVLAGVIGGRRSSFATL